MTTNTIENTFTGETINLDSKYNGDMSGLERVYTKDFKKKEKYVLTWDYYPFGGTYVTFTKTVPANTVWKGNKGNAFVVKAITTGMEFYILKNTYIFKEKELTPQDS